MATRHIILSVFILFVFMGFSQTEEQRKYEPKKLQELKSFVINSKRTDSLSTYFHSKDVYSDIYLDSPDFILLRSGFSLRFRKRISTDTPEITSYSFQLKSEMDSSNAIRMEVEESELFFYKVKTNEHWVSLSSVLDSFFYCLENNHDSNVAAKILTSWVSFKAGSAIAPFQKLLFLKICDLNQIRSLRPVTYGKSTRCRSHIYIDNQNVLLPSSLPNRVKADKLPFYFINNTNLIWVLESSLDYSTFYPLIPSQTPMIELVEYEVESKHSDIQFSTSTLNMYERALIHLFEVVPTKNSKYKQAMLSFLVL
jgi:hypothetical protein